MKRTFPAAQAWMELNGCSEWHQEAHLRDVPVHAKGWVLYQLKGHDWTIITSAGGRLGVRQLQSLSKKLDTKAFFLDIGDASATLYFAWFDGGSLALKHVSTPESPDDYAEDSVEACVSGYGAWIPSWMPEVPWGATEVRFTGWSHNDIAEMHYVD